MLSPETLAAPKTSPQDFGRMMQLATGMGVTAALQPIARMKIADLLSHGPLPVADLAERTHSNADALYRVMRLLASAGVFEEHPSRVFGLTPMSELLRSDTPGSLRDFIIWVSNRFHLDVWSALGYSIETGQPAVEKVTGRPCFDAIFGEPAVAADFNHAMTCFSRLIAPSLLDAYDFSGIGILMDVAGGHGAILCDVLFRYPKMKGILFDLPNVVHEANCNICAKKLNERCLTVTGDFFENIPAGADAYYMQHIIHDWADEPALKILGNVRRALENRPEGRLLLVDSVVAEDSAPDPAKWLDLEMLLMPGGRERTAAEWLALLGKANFEISRIIPIGMGKSVIEARVQR